jgi:outer membrane protein insertion porin family
MNKFFLIGIILIIATIGYAQNSLILEVKIEDNNKIDQELIKSLSLLEVGDNYTNDNISQTIKNLYQLGVFEDVSITLDEIDQGVIAHIKVKEFPIIKKLSFKDNDKIGTNKITESLTLKPGSYWSPFLESETRNQILEIYKEKGYHTVKIEFISNELKNGEIDLTIKIDEGKKVRIEKITFHGNKEISSKKLQKKIKTKPNSLFRSGKFDAETFEEDKIKIINFYNKEGYVDAQIFSTDVKLVNGSFLIDIYLFEGKQYLFGDVIIDGNTRFTEEVLKAQFKFNDGDLFDLQKFNQQINNVASMYHEDGYIYASFDHELNKDGDKINVALHINENTRAKVRKIHIKGNRKTKEKIIRRQLVIAPGDYFQQSKVQRSLSNIYNMGFFEADLYPDYKNINQNGDIDLIIHVNDKISGSANGGISVNSQDGIVGQLSVSHNNLFGNSWQSSVTWEFGGSTNNFSFSFTNPYFRDTNILVGLDFYHTTSELTTYKLQKNGASLRLGKPLTILNYSKLVMGYSLYSKKYDILSGQEDYATDTLIEYDEIGWQNTSSVSITVSRDTRDNVFFPTTGSNFTVYNEIAGGPLQGDFSYYKQIAQASWYTKTFWKLVLRTKWRFGYVEDYNNSIVPPDERFYLGGVGTDSVRGYADRSIGPVDENGNVTGGYRSIIFSSEYAAPLAGDQIVGLLFFDAGDSYNKLEEFNLWEFKSGAGAGIRIQSPFGLIGFDYAYNFTDKKWEPHFQFGTSF